MAIRNSFLAIVLVGLVAAASATGSDQLQANLFSEATNILGEATANVQGGLYGLVNGLFGPANSFYTQIPSDINSLSWDSIQNLGFSNPVKDFIESIQNKTGVRDVLAAEDRVTNFLEEFCHDSILEKAEQIPSNCVGKQMVVKLAPWACSLYENNTLACNPAFIEIKRSPAVCTAKHETAAVFTGKECKLRKTIGQEFKRTIGAQAFSVDISRNLLNLPTQVASSLLPGRFDTGAAVASAAAAVSAIATGGRH